MMGSADYNTIKNCTVTGPDQTNTLARGIITSGGGNDYNLIENVTVNSSLAYGVYLNGNSTTNDQGNEVRNCTFMGGRICVQVQYQNGASVHDCDLQPGYDTYTSTIYGIYCASQSAGALSTAYRNKIHNLRGSGSSNGIYAGPGAGAFFKAYNNFVYDYQVTGVQAHFGLQCGAGTSEFYFNSVYVGDVAATGNISGFYTNAASTVAVLKNNIIRIDEPTAACYAINKNVGTLTSDYNCVSGTGTGYSMGRVGVTNYATLALWQTATLLDSHSVEGNPGFVSATDLHIDSTYALVDEAGTPIAGITNDIDGQLRNAAFPDIGADEYAPVGHDFGVIGFVGLLPEYEYQTLYTIQADVQNNGLFNETNVPVRLYYAGVLQSTTLVALNAGIRDTVDLVWTTPDTHYEVDTLEVQAFCPHDGTLANDSALESVTVVGPPEEVDSLVVYQDVAAGDALLTWAPVARANSYKIYRGTSYDFVLDGTTYIGQTATTSYTDVDVLATAGSKYYVVIASTDVIVRER
jgi:hypothetical protein